MGVSSATATSTYSPLTYTEVPNWRDGIKMWDNRDYVVSGIQGPEMCEGGLYLRPSLHKVSILENDTSFCLLFFCNEMLL